MEHRSPPMRTFCGEFAVWDNNRLVCLSFPWVHHIWNPYYSTLICVWLSTPLDFLLVFFFFPPSVNSRGSNNQDTVLWKYWTFLSWTTKTCLKVLYLEKKSVKEHNYITVILKCNDPRKCTSKSPKSCSLEIVQIICIAFNESWKNWEFQRIRALVSFSSTEKILETTLSKEWG